MTLRFATTNKGKFTSVQRLFLSHNIEIIQEKLNIPEIQAEHVEEIAEDKVRKAFDHVNGPCMVQDSAFCIKTLRGFPGPYIKYVLGTLGIHGILQLRDENDPRCEFHEAHAYFDGQVLKIFPDVIPGKLSKTPAGERHESAWSDLWHIFQPEDWNKTIAEMTESERNAWRVERGETAAAKCAKWLANQK